VIGIGKNSVCIISVDAKDLFLSESCESADERGYKIRYANGDINTRKFSNTLDYSLDLIKLREVYMKTYRRLNFTFWQDKREYCQRVVNVTFKYSVKEYNRMFGNLYVKFGKDPSKAKQRLKDHLYYEDGELVAVEVGEPVEFPSDEEQLVRCFTFDGGAYRAKPNMKVLQSVADLRRKFYLDGFVCDGIRFVRFKRSAGSSRVGKCLFIDKNLYSRMHVWGLGGIIVKPNQQVDLAALESYISLTLSSIIGTIQIRPKNFLIIDDYESVFKDRVVAARIAGGWLKSETEEVEIRNSIWDGQSLIDASLLGSEYGGKGMVLLRNRFFKSACFNCNLQQFFWDNGISDVSQLNGRTIADDISDVKIITTPSSIKYLKFGSIDAWYNMVSSGCDFGVVKYEKPTPHFDGDMTQAHYQLLNTLQLSEEETRRLVQPSLDYLALIREDPAALRFHIGYDTGRHRVGSAETTSDVVYQMLGVTDKFCGTKMYYEYRKDILAAFTKNLRCGHLLVHGNYSTMLGNPMEMLQASIGRFDGKSVLGVGNIHSAMFAFDEIILGARSPHVTMGNVWLPRNVDCEGIRRYFNLTKEVVCVNSIGENLLQRLSGADFDSDAVLLTDNEILIECAKRNYESFLVPTSLVEARKVPRRYSSGEQADLDIKTSVNKIGEIVNLSQELNTKLWDRLNNGEEMDGVAELYNDIAKLDVMSGIEIDKAKKEFDVDVAAELRRLKKKYDERDGSGRLVKPNFFGKLAMAKGYYDSSKKSYQFHDTTMDYLQRIINRHRHKRENLEFAPFSSLLLPKAQFDSSSVNYGQIKQILSAVRDMKSEVSSIWESLGDKCENEEKFLLISIVKQKYTDYIKSLRLNSNTAYYLLLSIEQEKNRDISRHLFYSLFSIPNKDFLDLVEKSRTPVGCLVQDDCGSVKIYGKYYKTISNDHAAFLEPIKYMEKISIARHFINQS
jgi:hypothetical protein